MDRPHFGQQGLRSPLFLDWFWICIALRVPTIAICIGSLLVVPLAAQEASDLKALLAEVLENNPEVRAAQKKYEASRQRPSQVGSLPDPMFSPGYASNRYPWPGALLGQEPTSNIGFMVSQEVPFPGKRKLQADMAVKESEAEFQQYQQVQLNVVSRLKQAYYRRMTAVLIAETIDKSLNILRKLVQLTEARYSVGKASQQDIFKTQTQIALLQVERIQTTREQLTREAEIVSILNRPPGSKLGAPSHWHGAKLTATLAELFEAARQNSPLLHRDEKVIQRAELAINSARKEYYPDYTLNAGYFNMGSMPDMYQFRVDFKIPLYFFRKQRPGVTEKANELAQSRRLYEADTQNVFFAIQESQLMVQTSSQLIDVYRNAVIPQAGLTLESSLASYETGAVDFLTVFTNYLALVEYEHKYHDELQNIFLGIAKLEELTGKALFE